MGKTYVFQLVNNYTRMSLLPQLLCNYKQHAFKNVRFANRKLSLY